MRKEERSIEKENSSYRHYWSFLAHPTAELSNMGSNPKTYLELWRFRLPCYSHRYKQSYLCGLE
jgi:hypothetical protein